MVVSLLLRIFQGCHILLKGSLHWDPSPAPSEWTLTLIKLHTLPRVDSIQLGYPASALTFFCLQLSYTSGLSLPSPRASPGGHPHSKPFLDHQALNFKTYPLWPRLPVFCISFLKILSTYRYRTCTVNYSYWLFKSLHRNQIGGRISVIFPDRGRLFKYPLKAFLDKAPQIHPVAEGAGQSP